VAFFFLAVQSEALDDLVAAIHLNDEVFGEGVHMRIRIRDRVGEAEVVVDADCGFVRSRADQADAAFEGEDSGFGEGSLADPDDVSLIRFDRVAGLGEGAPWFAFEAGMGVVAGQFHVVGGGVGAATSESKADGDECGKVETVNHE